MCCLEAVTEPNDLAEADVVLPKVIEFGLLTDDALLMLNNIFSKVNVTAVWSGQCFCE